MLLLFSHLVVSDSLDCSTQGFPVLHHLLEFAQTHVTQVLSLGWQDSLEKGMATQSSILAWRSPWIAEPGGLQSMGSQKSGTQLSD